MEEVAKKKIIIGGSLPVQNVQALAASGDLSEIPERYVRPELSSDVTIIVNGVDIPVIDLGKLLDPQSSVNELTKLKFACEEWGFFQVINHGVPEEVTENLKHDLEKFFKLTLEEKKEVAQLPGGAEGYGQVFVLSEDQKLDWGDMYFLKLLPHTNRQMPLWTTNPSTFRTTLDKYSSEMKKILDHLLRSIAINLGLNPEKLLGVFKDGLQSTRMNYYPQCPHADKVIGLSPHSDHTGLTLLYEVNQVAGLQIRRNGGWLSVKPLSEVFVVNIGDMLEIMSNGKYKSIEHRATVNTEKERISIAVFHSPKYEAVVAPLPELVRGGDERYKSATVENFMRLTFSSKLDGKSVIQYMSKP